MNNQQVIATQCAEFGPELLEAIDKKAVIIIMQGQSVNATNGDTITVNNGIEGFIEKCLDEGKTRKEIIATLDKYLIGEVLERTRFNYLEASKVLNINNNTIHKKAKQLGLK